MTVSSTASSRKEYSGNGVTTEFPITFPYAAEADVIVLHVDALDVSTTWTNGGGGDTGYTIASSSVTANTAPASGETLILYRYTDQTQEVSMPNNQRVSGPVQEAALDKLTYHVQEIQEELGRSIQHSMAEGPVGVTATSIEAYIDTTVQAAIDDTQETNIFEDTASVGATSVTVTGFTLAASLDDIEIFIDGVKQATSSLTRDSDYTVSFGGALVGGELVEVRSTAANANAATAAAASAAAAAASASAAGASASAYSVVTDLAADVTAAGAADTTLVISDTQTIDDLTIPSNIDLQVLASGLISINTGETLTHNGSITAGPYQIFSGDGTVDLSGSSSIEYVMPQWWGDNGPTTLQAAITAFPTVYMPPGTYPLVNTVLLLKHNGTKIWGAGEATILTRTGTGGSAGHFFHSYVSAYSGITLRDFKTWYTNSDSVTSNGCGLIGITDGDNVHIENITHGCSVTNAVYIHGAGISLKTCNRVVIDNVRITDTIHHTFIASSADSEDNENVVIQNCYWKLNSPWALYPAGVYLEHGIDITMVNNHMEGGHGVAPGDLNKGYGFYGGDHNHSVGSPNWRIPKNVTIEGNTFRDCDVSILSQYPGEYKILNNHAREYQNDTNADPYGISLTLSQDSPVVVAVQFKDVLISGNSVSSISISSSKDTIISNNVVDGSTGVGINMSDPVTNAVITSNIIRDPQQAGIRVYSDGTGGGCLIKGNIISDPNQAAYTGADGTGHLRSYIAVSNIDNVIIEDNILTDADDNVYTPIYLTSRKPRTTVRNNIIRGFTWVEPLDTGAASATGNGIVGAVTAAPTEGPWLRGDVVWHENPSSAGAPGWVCVSRLDTQLDGGEPSGESDMVVDASTNMLDGDIIGVEQDDGTIHWTTIASGQTTTTLVLTDVLTDDAADGSYVYTFRFVAMANLQ